MTRQPGAPHYRRDPEVRPRLNLVADPGDPREASGVARPEAEVLAHRVALHLAGSRAEDVEHPDLASLGGPLAQDRLDHLLPVVVLDVA
jgi:hypothetical protein